MSEQGWRSFLAAEGVEDWVVLHGGATAAFRITSLSEAARLAEAIARLPGLAGVGVLLTLTDSRLTVRLTRDLRNLELHHIQLARAISAVAREHGAVPDRAAVQEVQVAIAAKREERLSDRTYKQFDRATWVERIDRLWGICVASPSLLGAWGHNPDWSMEHYYYHHGLAADATSGGVAEARAVMPLGKQHGFCLAT